MIGENVPKKFHGYLLYGSNDLRFEEIEYDFTALDKDYLVVKVDSAGLGPYDTGFINGRLTPKKYPTTLGAEGSGCVVMVGDNVSQDLIGKRVGFLAAIDDEKAINAYSEYAVVSKRFIIVLDDNIDMNQGAYLLGNPLTALVLFNTLVKNHSSVIQDTASSQIGKMITRLCVKNNIKIINVVRKDENVHSLQEIGSTYTLNSTSPNFPKSIMTAIQDTLPSLYLTYQGGTFPSSIFEKLPDGSVMCSLGNINREQLGGFSSTDFIFKKKSIIGFHVLTATADMQRSEIEDIMAEIMKSVASGEKTFATEIIKEYPLSELLQAKADNEKDMSKGKVIIKV